MSADAVGLRTARVPELMASIPGWDARVECSPVELKDAGSRLAIASDYVAAMAGGLGEVQRLLGGLSRTPLPALGSFAEAENILEQHEGLNSSFESLLKTVLTALDKATAALRESAKNYESVEERNRMSAEQLGLSTGKRSWADRSPASKGVAL
ncbi:MAG: hypothetical protein H0T78_10175 [Longispora sp.]|nr:hypothetical protein [Longispora sp. (in: high G+C Gram-positive bacteria)]